jgi:triphosphatase
MSCEELSDYFRWPSAGFLLKATSADVSVRHADRLGQDCDDRGSPFYRLLYNARLLLWDVLTMASDKQEIEWQFDAPDLSVVATWLRRRSAEDGWQVHEEGTREITDSYFDTPEWHLFRAGYVLRVRSSPRCPTEVTLKSFGVRQAGLRSRREISESLTDAAGDHAVSVRQVTGPVKQHIRTIVGQGQWPGQKLFSAHTRRVSFALCAGQVRLAEIALDATSIHGADRSEPATALARVEVEALSPQTTEDVARFVAQMRAACDLRPATRSKFELGLRAQGIKPSFAPNLGKPAKPAKVGEDEAIATLAFAVLREHFDRWLTVEPAVRLGEDAEAIHRGRVAIRRLRSALSLFRAYLPAEAQQYREEWAWVADLLGAVRDLDVQREQLLGWQASRAFPWADDLAAAVEWIARQRAKAQAALLRGLNSVRYQRFALAFTRFLRAGEAKTNEDGSAPVRQALPKLIRKRHAKLRRLGDTLGPHSSLEDYHALRIRCKRLRYALEAGEHLFGHKVRAYLSRCIALQDLLGEIQDARVAARQARDWAISARPSLPPATVFALGAFAHHYIQRVDALLDRFPERYRSIKAWKSLHSAMTE